MVIFCLLCKHEGRRWILPDCPHEWETGGERLTRWAERVKAKFRRK